MRYTLLLILISSKLLAQTITTSIYFNSDNSDLSISSKKALDDLYNDVATWKTCEIEIKGHTDSVASDEYNKKLSERRAKAVSEYLVSLGLNKEQIVVNSFGESKPAVPNISERNKARNRRVEIIARKERKFGTVSTEVVTKGASENGRKFENDTVIVCKNGTRIEIQGGAFFPRKLSEVILNIEEYNSNCDLLNSKVNMVTESGDCLTSGGMVLIRPTVDTIEVYPNFGYKIKVSIPAYKNVIDKDMQVYLAVKKNGNTIWKETSIELQKDNRNGINYYVFESDTINGFNIDRSVRARCEEDGPLVKVRGYKETEVFMTYPGELYLSRGLPLSSSTYSLVKAAEGKIPTLSVVAYEGYDTYLATGALPDLKYRKNKNTYIVKKKYFRLVKVNNDNSVDELCQILNGK